MDIPQGIYTDIIEHLNPKHILLLSRTCKQLYDIVFEDLVNMRILANKTIVDLSDATLEELYTDNKYDLSKYYIDYVVQQCKNDKIMKYIIDNIYNLNHAYDDDDGNENYRFVHDICKKASLNIIKYLIDKNIDINCIDYKPYRPIHYIISRFDANIELIKYFVDKGAELECYDEREWYPIHHACDYSSYEIIKYLLEKGVNVNVIATYHGVYQEDTHRYANEDFGKDCIQLIITNKRLTNIQKKELILQIHELSNNEHNTNKLINLLKN
jgi:ankyrin repeat protein